jgi:hypothetical protein
MAITNGYATLAEVKDRLFDSKTYRTTTITFTSTGSLINDPAGGLGKFDAGETISITTASGSNTGNYAIITGASNTQLTLGSAVVTLASGSLTTVTTALADDNALEMVITTVSRWIDAYTNRHFYTTSGSETRYFTASEADYLDCGDIISVTALKTDDAGARTYGNTWDTDDYDLCPYNAGLKSEPYTYIEITNSGSNFFPARTKKGVRIDGFFGWSAAPEVVREACILQSVRLYKRKDAPFGIAGSNDFGTLQIVPNLDPDVRQLLNSVIMPAIGST